MLARRKLEYTDFSAGITENLVPGKMNAYARADNKLITRDKQLETRPGSKIYGDTLYQLPTGQQRVGALFPFHNDSELFAQSGREVYRAATTWEHLLGPTGNSAFASNTTGSRVLSAENRKRLYMVSDSGDGPQMVYPDESGAYQLKQAGLPKVVFDPTYSDIGLLSAAITLAVAVKTAMQTHYSDTASHVTAHSSAASALSALVAPANLSDLITYVGTLKTQYNLHISDAQLDDVSGPQVYHANAQKRATASGSHLGRHSVLNALASTRLDAPTDLDTTVAVLNDLRTRYNFHTYSTLTHINAITSLTTGGYWPATAGTYSTNLTGYGLNAVVLSEVRQNSLTVADTTVYNPVFSEQLGTLLAYVNQVKSEYNTHLGSTSHDAVDSENLITVADATDAFSAYVIMAHLEFFYWWHYSDAATLENGGSALLNAHTFTGTITTASPIIASSSLDNVGGPWTNLRLSYATWSPGGPFWQKVTLSASATALVTSDTTAGQLTFNHPLTPGVFSGVPAIDWRIVSNRYHYGLDFAAGSVTNPTRYAARVGNYDLTSLDSASLLSSVVAFQGMLKTHQISGWVSQTVNENVVYFVTHTGQSSTNYTTHYAVDSGDVPGSVWPQATIIVDGETLTSPEGVDYFDNPPETGPVLYSFVWRHDYRVESILFTDESTPAQYSQLTWVPSPSQDDDTALYPTTLSSLPVLSNAANENWDTSNIYLDIYRTITNGQSFFKVGSVTNGTTTFVDEVTDDDLISGQNLYTTGGVVANDQPPASRFITMMNSTAYYGYVTDITSGEVFPNRVLQSIQGAPAAVPATFFDDLDDELSGLANFNSSAIALCLSSLYRLEGTYNELGQNGITHQEISKTMGNVSAESIVTTEVGIFFCGTNGISWTDGYTARVVSTELDLTYASYIETNTQRLAISGAYDRLRRRVYWKFKSNPTTEECDLMWVLDLNWGISEKMSFTTMSGGARFTPTALSFYRNRLIRGDALGYVFKYDPLYKNDPLIDPDEDATDWLEQPILWDFESCSTNFGSSQVKKWVTRITVQGKNRSNLSLQISHKNDNGKSGYSSLVPIRIRNNVRWGDYRARWGDVSCLWKYDGMIDDFRRFNAGTLRCDWKSVRMQNAYVIVDNSDDADTAGYATEDGA